MSTSSSNNKVLLKSCDGKTFEVDEVVASESLTIKHVIEFLKDVPSSKSADGAITLEKVTGEILAKVIEYCKKHVLASESADPLVPRAVDDDELKAFDVEFLNVDNNNTLVDLVSAASYLNIKGLLDLTCKAVADKLNGKTAEEMRAEFNIVNDLTPEEEEQMRKENEWAFGDDEAPTFAAAVDEPVNVEFVLVFGDGDEDEEDEEEDEDEEEEEDEDEEDGDGDENEEEDGFFHLP